jgi:uncharacterized protein YggU (UPF0235/DUF167 family)
MARPRVDLPPPEAIRALIDDSGRIAVRVPPGARQEGLAIVDGRLLARVRAAPEAGRANAAVIELLAQALGMAASRVHLLRGATSRDKLLRVDPA